MFKKILLTVAIISASVFAKAQEEKSITLLPNWAKNESFKYKVVKKYSKFIDAKMYRNDSLVYSGTLKVLDFKGETYRMSWTTNLKNIDLIAKSGIDKKYIDNIPAAIIPTIIFTINGKGENFRVENWKEVGDAVGKPFNEVLASMKANKDVTNTLRASSMAQIASALKNEKGVISALADELNYMNKYFNVQLKADKLRKYNERSANVFGAMPLVMDGVTTLSFVDTVKKECSFSNVVTLNEASAKSVIQSVKEKNDKANKDNKNKLILDTKNDKLSVMDVSKLVFNYKRGVAKHIEAEKKSTISLLNLKENRSEVLILDLLD